MRLPDHSRAVVEELSRYGIKPKMEPTRNGHVRFRWDVGGKPLEMITGGNPSDLRAVHNNVARVKRLLKEAGIKEPTAPAPKPNGKLITIDERIARLEAAAAKFQQSVDTLIDLVTDPKRFIETFVPTLAPEPIPAPEPAPVKLRKIDKRGADCWLWRAMRYDQFLTVREIAKAAGKANGATSVMLTVWSKKGFVDHVGKGWRKNRKVEELGATHH